MTVELELAPVSPMSPEKSEVVENGSFILVKKILSFNFNPPQCHDIHHLPPFD